VYIGLLVIGAFGLIVKVVINVFIGYLFLTILINLGNLIMVIANNTGHKVAYNKKYNSKPPLSLKHP
jgi:hypothetical protein